jgi:hypothetical protein
MVCSFFDPEDGDNPNFTMTPLMPGNLAGSDIDAEGAYFKTF